MTETDLTQGAALAIYDQTGKITGTPAYRSNPPLAGPLRCADLDGDGTIELACIDRPHLAKTLHIWRFENGKLTPVADHPGPVNHQIGQDFISGGIRKCAGDLSEIITANKNRTRLIANILTGTQIKTRDTGPTPAPPALPPPGLPLTPPLFLASNIPGESRPRDGGRAPCER